MTNDKASATSQNPVKLYTPTQRQAMARLLVKNIPASIERKKRQIEELQSELAVLEYNLREAERILAALAPSQPGVGGGGEPDDAGVAIFATPVKLTARNSVILKNIKRMFNRTIYTSAMTIANESGEDAAIAYALRYVNAKHTMERQLRSVAQS